MNAVGTLLGETVTKRYPRRGSVQLMRLRAAVSFTCSQCRQVKKSRLVAVSGANLLCNGCYGRGEAEATEQGQTPSSETAMSLRTFEPSSPPLGVEPSARGTGDPARIVVSQSDSGLPYSVMDADMTVTWKVHVRARDLLDGTSPVPAQMADKAPHTPLNAAFVRGRGRKARNIFDYQPGVRLRLDGGRTLLVGVSWHPHVLPGTRVSVRWDQRTRTRLHFSYTRLSKPVVFGGTVVRYAYDPKVMTRELAAFDVRLDRVEELVLIALRELGYLDERGRALLPQEALLRNTVERAQPERHSTKKIREATERLLSRGILTWEEGSFNRAGELHHPARYGETPIPLLCYTPTLRDAERENPRNGVGAAYSASAHRVAGHLMRIGHLGKEASPEARAAYREDHRRAGLAGPHELPRGFTYVREHERGM